MKHSSPKFVPAMFLAMLTACSVGPDYVRPAIDTPPAYKEAVDGVKWEAAHPDDTAIPINWWRMLKNPDGSNDQVLDDLEKQTAVSNQNVQQAEARYRQAQAAVTEAKAAFYPKVTAGFSDIRSNTPASTNFFGDTVPGAVQSNYTASLQASWEIDVWGKVRRQVEASDASSQSSDADLRAENLSIQAELATDYANLRFIDQQKRLLDGTVANYEKTYKLTQNLYDAGIGRRTDAEQAAAKFQATKSQAIDTGVMRAQYEHAIAILIGKAPSDFVLAPDPAVPLPPEIPPGVPSELLQRRPDIASAERKAAAANAQIGVAVAAFYPSLTLNASAGYQSYAFSKFNQLFNEPDRFWSIGPSLNETLFDAGLHAAQEDEAIAMYDAAVATYRQTVLGAFKDVEDNLAALRVLGEESGVRRAAVVSSTKADDELLYLYKAGSGRFTDVLVAENDELTNELAALDTEKQRVVDSIALIKALGGGWAASADPMSPPPSGDAAPVAMQKNDPAPVCLDGDKQCSGHNYIDIP